MHYCYDVIVIQYHSIIYNITYIKYQHNNYELSFMFECCDCCRIELSNSQLCVDGTRAMPKFVLAGACDSRLTVSCRRSLYGIAVAVFFFFFPSEG